MIAEYQQFRKAALAAGLIDKGDYWAVDAKFEARINTPNPLPENPDAWIAKELVHLLVAHLNTIMYV